MRALPSAPHVTLRTLLAASLLAGSLLGGASSAAGAQEATPTSPEISASAFGEVKAVPDRATILFSVETRGATAAEASTENATRQTAVLAALRSAGLPEDDIGTVSYTIQPNVQYDEPRRASRVVGYIARNTIRADVRDLARVGRVIDAAIRAGANEVSSLQFWTSQREALRLDAIRAAMQRACAEAATIATAAGGSLGPLVAANTSDGPGYPPPPPAPAMAMRMEAAMADTPITPRDVTINVAVFTRWRFVPAGVAAPAGSPSCR